jgi:hypothetical protein
MSRLRFGTKYSAATTATSVVASAPSSSSSSLSLSPSGSAHASAAEWRLVSVERVGLCAIDLRQGSQYATKNYKEFDASPAPSAAAASIFTTAATAASVSSSRIHDFGTPSVSAIASPLAPSGCIVFLSSHFDSCPVSVS